MKPIILFVWLFAGFAASAQNVGINTPIPTETLDANGTVKITDGTQGNGKVLTSDADGKASWKSTAYGENIRFCFRRNEQSGDTLLQTYYSNDLIDVDLDGSDFGIDGSFHYPGILLYINEPRLYHFDIHTDRKLNWYGSQPAPSNAEALSRLEIRQIMPTAIGGDYDFYFLGRSYGVPILTQFNNIGESVASIDKSLDAYFATTGMIYFFTEYEYDSDISNLSVSGAKIAD